MRGGIDAYDTSWTDDLRENGSRTCSASEGLVYHFDDPVWVLFQKWVITQFQCVVPVGYDPTGQDPSVELNHHEIVLLSRPEKISLSSLKQCPGRHSNDGLPQSLSRFLPSRSVNEHHLQTIHLMGKDSVVCLMFRRDCPGQ